MQHSTEEKVLFFCVVASLILYVFMLMATNNTIANVSAMQTNGVGVYWDSNCTNRVSSISWGNLTPGSAKNFAVYIRNEAGVLVELLLWTANWNPAIASGYINLGWNYTAGRWINPGEVLRTTLTLSVSRYIAGISSFNFDIVITATDSLVGDVNGDGKVDIRDLSIVARAFGSQPDDPNWNPLADITGPAPLVPDGEVDIRDIGLAAKNFGKTYP